MTRARKERKKNKAVGDLGRGRFPRRIFQSDFIARPVYFSSFCFLRSLSLVFGFLQCFDSGFFSQEFMVYRKHTYMRLDGSSKISERRDMVADFQSR